MNIKTVIALAAFVATPSAHAGLIGELLDAVSSTGPKKFLIHMEAEGPRTGWESDGSPVYRIDGAIYAGAATGANANLDPGYGVRLGELSGWKLSVSVGGDATGFVNTDTRLRCNPCTIRLDDGGVFEALLDKPSTILPERDIPLDARLLPELGPVATDDTVLPAHMRTAGCVGLREVTGKGKFAWSNGTLCLNGVVKFRTWPANAAAVGAEDYLGLESDSTLTVHRPLADLITIR